MADEAATTPDKNGGMANKPVPFVLAVVVNLASQALLYISTVQIFLDGEIYTAIGIGVIELGARVLAAFRSLEGWTADSALIRSMKRNPSFYILAVLGLSSIIQNFKVYRGGSMEPLVELGLNTAAASSIRVCLTVMAIAQYVYEEEPIRNYIVLLASVAGSIIGIGFKVAQYEITHVKWEGRQGGKQYAVTVFVTRCLEVVYRTFGIGIPMAFIRPPLLALIIIFATTSVWLFGALYPCLYEGWKFFGKLKGPWWKDLLTVLSACFAFSLLYFTMHLQRFVDSFPPFVSYYRHHGVAACGTLVHAAFMAGSLLWDKRLIPEKVMALVCMIVAPMLGFFTVFLFILRPMAKKVRETKYIPGWQETAGGNSQEETGSSQTGASAANDMDDSDGGRLAVVEIDVDADDRGRTAKVVVVDV